MLGSLGEGRRHLQQAAVPTPSLLSQSSVTAENCEEGDSDGGSKADDDDSDDCDEVTLRMESLGQ